MAKKVKYPIGQQSFKALREGGYLYVDKTMHIETLLDGGQYYFLGRPRRFGKSLFLSTLKSFFKGERELFKGLYADTMEWSWEQYPVLYIDLNFETYTTGDQALTDVLDMHLGRWEKEYGVDRTSDNASVRFRMVIEGAYRKTGKQVVILVDEYDKPLVNNIGNPERFESFRDRLASIYSNFKSSAEYIKLVFLTGVSRFGKLTVFSGLNNIQDISFDTEFSDVCGITEDELEEYFHEGIESIGKSEGLSEEEVKTALKKYYYGYTFAPEGCDIYNPFSILNVMGKKWFQNYWIQSGTPSLLREVLMRDNMDLREIFNMQCTQESLVGIDMTSRKPLALLYQTGYLTIKNYDRESGIFTLGLPNLEVKRGFLTYLLPWYTSLHSEDTALVVHEFVQDFKAGDVVSFMKRLESLFAKVSYKMEMDNEKNLHNALYMLMILVGLQVKTEYETSDGRIDLLVETDRYVYIIELKKDCSPEEALRQIDEKRYARQFTVETRKVIKVGVNFSTTTRTIEGWVAEDSSGNSIS